MLTGMQHTPYSSKISEVLNLRRMAVLSGALLSGEAAKTHAIFLPSPAFTTLRAKPNRHASQAKRPSTTEASAKHFLKRQFHTTQVGAVAWELHVSFRIDCE